MSTANGFNPWRLPADDPIPTVQPVEGPPLEVQLVSEVRRPPHPGFWMALLWAVVFVIVVNGGAFLVLLPILIYRTINSPDPDAFLDRLATQSPQGEVRISPEFARDLAPAVLAGQLLSILFAWLMIRLLVGRDWKRELAFRLPSLQHLVLILIGLPAFLILPEAIVALARMLLPTTDYQKELNQLLEQWPLAYGILAVAIGAGIGEELWCRGFLGRGLLGRYGFLGGVVLTSLLFGAMHVDPPHIVGTAFMGVALHYVYITTRSLVAPMIIHALNNGIAFVLVYLARENRGLHEFLERLDQVPLPSRVPLYAACVILLGVVGWALYRTRTDILSSPSSAQEEWQPEYPGVQLPPADSGAFLHTPRLGVGMLGVVLISMALFFVTFWWTAKAASSIPKPLPAGAVGSLDSPCLIHA